MEAIEFLKGTQRMCRSTECHLNCPVPDVCFLQNYDVVSEDDMKTFVSSVEAWRKKNPPKTNAQKFKEVFGEKRLSDLIGCKIRNASGEEIIVDIQKTKWWDEPYKEPEHED